jgi:hypothetical protein
MRLDAESGYTLTYVRIVYSSGHSSGWNNSISHRFGWKRGNKASIGTLPLGRSEAASKMGTYTKHVHRTLSVMTIPVTWVWRGRKEQLKQVHLRNNLLPFISLLQTARKIVPLTWVNGCHSNVNLCKKGHMRQVVPRVRCHYFEE